MSGDNHERLVGKKFEGDGRGTLESIIAAATGSSVYNIS
jgi:hypothetical protein